MSSSSISVEQWGRVDDEGTVWVRTREGERAVGSYPGASPGEALAYFGRKYEELAGQIELLEQRLRATDVSSKDASAALEKLRAAVPQARAVGDLDALAARLEGLQALVEERRLAGEAARARAREQARAEKERLVTEVESLAQSTAWKVAGERLRTLLDEWKAAPRLDRRSDDELWKRFSAARSAFDRRRRAHFGALETQREEIRGRKERIATEAEALAGSTDWAATAARYRALLEEWKAAGRGARTTDDTLWARFRAAQDSFFAARTAASRERDAGLHGNLEQKEALAAEAEALLPVRDLRATKRTLRAIQQRWEAVGPLPRDARDRVEGRLKKVEAAVRSAEQDEWRRANPESRARAESAVAQLETAIRQYEAQAAAARAAGQDRKAVEAEAAVAARRAWLAEAQKYTR
ncbi:MAG: DUF349 domain-containing protein [Actinomycetota bacterium]|nr:DUF349 domain-containing protein [Actinomycetota bacterium]